MIETRLCNMHYAQRDCITLNPAKHACLPMGAEPIDDADVISILQLLPIDMKAGLVRCLDTNAPGMASKHPCSGLEQQPDMDVMFLGQSSQLSSLHVLTQCQKFGHPEEQKSWHVHCCCIQEQMGATLFCWRLSQMWACLSLLVSVMVPLSLSVGHLTFMKPCSC